MRYYELLYIVNPNFEDERVKSIIGEVSDELNKHNVKIINHHVWGKKRLAYAVNNNKYGTYILLQFAAESFDFLKEFERYLILSKTVIRHQIVKLDEEPKVVESLEIEDDDDDLSNNAEDASLDVGDVDEDDETGDDSEEEIDEDQEKDSEDEQDEKTVEEEEKDEAETNDEEPEEEATELDEKEEKK